MRTVTDTSFLFSLANRRDRFHKRCLELAQILQAHLIVPITVLPETAYLIDTRLGHHVMRRFVQQVNAPQWTLEPLLDVDLIRTSELLEKYADNRLDFVDATLIAIAERLNIRQILTLDRRHFRVIRPSHCEAFELLPE